MIAPATRAERERHPILSLDAENRKMAHKPIAHQVPREARGYNRTLTGDLQDGPSRQEKRVR
jgi:hypothetical protein